MHTGILELARMEWIPGSHRGGAAMGAGGWAGGTLPAWRLGTHVRDSQPLTSEQTGHEPKKGMGSCHMVSHMRHLSSHRVTALSFLSEWINSM